MGNLVVFRREADPVALDAGTGRSAVPPDNIAWPDPLDAEFLQHVRGGKSSSLAVFRRFAGPRTVHDMAAIATHPDLDGYLLVLLADNEFTAGRDLQAETLLDAAYAAFDRHAPSQSDQAVRF